MARYRAQGYFRAFEKSFAMHRQAEQDLKEREQERMLPTTTYTIYVGGKLVHQCSEWYEAHGVHHRIYSIEEWTALSIYTAINGVPKWGITPKYLEDPKEARRFKSNRTRYLHKSGKSEQECEQIGKEKLATIIADVQAQLAKIK